MQISSSHGKEYLWLAFFVLVLTPVLYAAFRYAIFVYGLIWLLMLVIGPMSNKYPLAKLFQIGLFIALVISMLVGMVPK